MRAVAKWMIAAGAAAGLVVPAVAAPFAPTVCMQLEARLIGMERGGGDQNRLNYEQFDESATRQRAELERARYEASRRGCQQSFGFFRPAQRDPRCETLLGTISRMEDNYNRLLQRRDQYRFDPYEVDRSRSQILRALGDNNCGPEYDRYRGFAGLFVFGNRRWGEPAAPGNTFRTLCVRLCDGYYFPISFSTVRAKFASDEQACRAMCPNTDVALYVHHNPGEESDAMVSAAGGQPYSALPSAFAFRQTFDPSCSCGARARMTPIPAGATTQMLRIVPVPATRPNRAEDPDTLANRAGDFVPARSAPIAVPDLTATGAAPGRQVRVVGPSYYYAQ